MNILVMMVIAACLLLAGCGGKSLFLPSYNAAGPIEKGFSKAALPDGSVYEGEFLDGLFAGNGNLKWSNGDSYSGNFKSGLFHGQGVLALVTGDRYEGEFEAGLFHGAGVYTTANGDTYRGGFEHGTFTGEGVFISETGDRYEGEFLDWIITGEGILTIQESDKYSGSFVKGVPNGKVVVEFGNGDRYEGGMSDWQFHGDGVMVSANGSTYSGRYEYGLSDGVMKVEHPVSGDKYEGELERWIYHGKGVLKQQDGDRYEGEFAYGRFNGQGNLISKDGKKYEGEFEHGRYHGEGRLEYVDRNGDKQVLSGRWENGKYAGEDAADYRKDGLSKLIAEQIMYDQPSQVAKVLKALSPQTPGRPDLYFVAFGSYGSQDVFMKEVQYSSSVMDKHYDVGKHSVQLINNPQTVDDVPLASVTNLKVVLGGIADIMDVEEDILFLFVTSHGSKEHEIEVELDDLPLQGLTVSRFKKILNNSGIKWKIALVSACYSGGFIDALKDEYTLIITAARADRTSFGCSDDAELTYFGRAFFEKSLTPDLSFIETFEQARELISGWEKKEELEPSEPQIFFTDAIENKLAEWQRKQKLSLID